MNNNDIVTAVRSEICDEQIDAFDTFIDSYDLDHPDVWVKVDVETDTENFYSTHSIGPIGAIIQKQITVELDLDGLTKRRMFYGETKSVTYEDDSDKHKHSETVWSTDDFSAVHCPLCEHQFNRDDWTETRSFGDRTGSSVYYDCPSESCEGEIVVVT